MATVNLELKTPGELLDDIVRLRKALEEIAGDDPPSTLDEPDMDFEVVRKLRAIASAALDQQ